MWNEWLTSEEARRYSGLSLAQLTLLCRRESITCKKWGRDWMIARDSLQAYQQRWAADWKEPIEQVNG